MPEFHLDDEMAHQILENPVLLDAMHELAEQKLLPAAASLAARQGLTDFAASLHVEDGRRPKGRTFSRVVADSDDAIQVEFGDSKTKRYRILGRAAGFASVWPDEGAS